MSIFKRGGRVCDSGTSTDTVEQSERGDKVNVVPIIVSEMSSFKRGVRVTCDDSGTSTDIVENGDKFESNIADALEKFSTERQALKEKSMYTILAIGLTLIIVGLMVLSISLVIFIFTNLSRGGIGGVGLAMVLICGGVIVLSLTPLDTLSIDELLRTSYLKILPRIFGFSLFIMEAPFTYMLPPYTLGLALIPAVYMILFYDSANLKEPFATTLASCCLHAIQIGSLPIPFYLGLHPDITTTVKSLLPENRDQKLSTCFIVCGAACVILAGVLLQLWTRSKWLYYKSAGQLGSAPTLALYEHLKCIVFLRRRKQYEN